MEKVKKSPDKVNTLVLKKPIFFPAGTIFHSIAGRKSTVGEDVFAHSFGLQPDSSGEIVYRMDEGDEEFFEPYAEADLNPASLIKRERDNFQDALNAIFKHFEQRTGACITNIDVASMRSNGQLKGAWVYNIDFSIPEDPEEETSDEK